MEPTLKRYEKGLYRTKDGKYEVQRIDGTSYYNWSIIALADIAEIGCICPACLAGGKVATGKRRVLSYSLADCRIYLREVYANKRKFGVNHPGAYYNGHRIKAGFKFEPLK